MSELKLNIKESLQFLDMLDPGGRHTIASEAPFGGKDDGPRWEGGATYEAIHRDDLIKDIQARQSRRSNVYYSVNRPCSIIEQQGSRGKNNIDDIIAIRALAFDIDFVVAKTDELIKSLLSFIDREYSGDLKPSLVISTGGGFQLIYLLVKPIKTRLYRKQPITDEQKELNAGTIFKRSLVTQMAHSFEVQLRAKVPKELPIKIDNMSNVDRVMRLPGTVNYPKLEKIAKGQKPALATILVDYHCKTDMTRLRDQVPIQSNIQEKTQKPRFIPRANDPWTAYEKAKACIEFIRDQGLADSNETYTIHVMLPLIGAIHDEEKHSQLTIEEAEELFLEAVSGGERYGTMGRGEGYFRRQWRSHRPELGRNGTKKLGGLIWFSTQNGFKLPWVKQITWNYDEQKEQLEKLRQTAPDDIIAEIKKRT
jgi:hypothetical protein